MMYNTCHCVDKRRKRENKKEVELHFAIYKLKWSAVVVQLVERLLPIPEVRGLNPVISKNLYWTLYCQLYWKDKNKEKEAGNGLFKKWSHRVNLIQQIYIRMNTLLWNKALWLAKTCHTTSVTRLGDLLHFGQFLKSLATITLHKSPTF